MKRGHATFLAGAAGVVLGVLITTAAIFTLNFGLAYIGEGVSLLGGILVFAGIHIFMRETVREVGHVWQAEAQQFETKAPPESAPRMAYPQLPAPPNASLPQLPNAWRIFVLVALIVLVLVLLGVLLK